VATDAHERSVLATVRCLGDEGWSVTSVATTPLAPGLWSRASNGRRLAPDPRYDVDGFIGALEGILRHRRYRALLPGTDAALVAVSRHRDRLERYVDLGLPPHEVVERVLDKEQLAAEAARAGLPGPEQAVCGTLDDALDAAHRYGYPVHVKPVHTVLEGDGSLRRDKSLLVPDDEALRQAVERHGRCIVQRRVAGHVISFAGVATAARLLAYVVSRYRRTWPAEAGNASFSETIACPPELAARVQALVRGLGWLGLFELELIDGSGREPAAIDFNPRPYGSLSLAMAAGVPLPALWCEWLLGAEPRPVSARIGVRYRWEDAEVRHLLWQLCHRRPQAAMAVLRPPRAAAHAYSHARDPIPAAARLLELAGGAWSHRSAGSAATGSVRASPD
jgi:predicted ATP-grasp superfamily ATP-dependent carboligase